MIVVDTSAILAIWQKEHSYQIMLNRLLDEPAVERRISVAGFVEAGTVFASRRMPKPMAALYELENLIAGLALELIPVDAEQSRVALEARIRYGRGFRHGAKLNFGDCFSYALAKVLAAPLLYVGNDFSKTDVVSALAGKHRSKKGEKP